VFRDKTVLVSATASGLFDQHTGPFAGEYPGGELLATTIDDLESGSALSEASPPVVATLVGVLVAAAVVPVLVLSPAVGLPLGAAVIACFVGVAIAVFARSGLVLPLLSPVAAATTSLGISAGARWAAAARRSREVRAVFSRYVSDVVVSRLLESPAALDLGGTETEVSVLFSDIRDFTSHTERMSPHDLVAQLNEHFAAITELIHGEEGTINKFIGDAVMAFFGAPLPQPDHAARAVRAGLAMLEAVERLNVDRRAQGRPEWAIGVGIASGPVIVGNVGSARHADFTVIGDTVNLASRLEGENKALGTRILVSEATAKALGENFSLRPRGEVKVKGKEKPVAVFEIVAMGRREQPI
jgi:adenylate cyclase